MANLQKKRKYLSRNDMYAPRSFFSFSLSRLSTKAQCLSTESLIWKCGIRQVLLLADFTLVLPVTALSLLCSCPPSPLVTSTFRFSVGKHSHQEMQVPVNSSMTAGRMGSRGEAVTPMWPSLDGARGRIVASRLPT